MKHIAMYLFTAGCIAAVLMIFASAEMISRYSRSRIYNDTDSIPYCRVALVLGCSKYLSGGRQNLFFRYRIDAATQLYMSGKADFLIVSGDNHKKGYDEPSQMKEALIQCGVPADRVYCDYAGFRTLDSVIRAKEIFEQSDIIIVSQQFHNERAVFIAGKYGLNAIAFNAKEVNAYDSFRTKFREQFARVKTIADIYLIGSTPRFLGEKICIG